MLIEFNNTNYASICDVRRVSNRVMRKLLKRLVEKEHLKQVVLVLCLIHEKK